MEHVHKIAEMETSVIQKLNIVLNVIKLVVYVTEVIIPCAQIVMIVGTLIVMVAMNVMTNVVNVQVQQILNVKRVTRVTSLIQAQLVMKRAPNDSLEMMKLDYVKIVLLIVQPVIPLKYALIVMITIN
jgi:hypothetical protein